MGDGPGPERAHYEACSGTGPHHRISGPNVRPDGSVRLQSRNSDGVSDSTLDLAVLNHLSLIKARFLAEPLEGQGGRERPEQVPHVRRTIEWMEDHGINL